MSTVQWDGQELYNFDGTIVFIIERVETDYVRIAEFQGGRVYEDFIFEGDLETASPEDLEGVA